MTETEQAILQAIEKLNTRFDSADDRLSALDGRMGSMESRLVSVDGRMSSIEGRMSTIETVVADLNFQIKTWPDMHFLAVAAKQQMGYSREMKADVADIKARMAHCHTSQMYEWLPYDGGYLDQIPADDAERLTWLQERLTHRDANVANRFREKLVARYGAERGNAIRCAEAFEVSEYGRGLRQEDVDIYFPK